jgi:hypothetical protein
MPDAHRHLFAPRWPLAFTKGVILWLIPAAIVWLIATPYYNRFLTKAGENLVRLGESPAVTRLQVQDDHTLLINRTDVPAPKGYLYQMRLTDVHFPLMMLAAFFLAVPGVPMRRRLESLLWAFLISVCFHVVSVALWVKFAYATQLGDWSLQNYGAFGRNFWGISKHLADLPFKFGMPVLLWSFFFLGEILPGRGAKAGARASKV